MILLDSNVVIDLLGNDATWRRWSAQAVAMGGSVDELLISPIVVAEVAPRMASLAAFVERISRFGASIVDFGSDAAYAAGNAFALYRGQRHRTGESPKRILPGFLIGGHAETLGATIITRDPRFYRAYFPAVPLITPSIASSKDEND